MAIKWTFDRIMALIGIIAVSPVILIIYIIIRIDEPQSPAFFWQERIGKDGQKFKICKFRTMAVDYNASSISVAGQASITRIGAVLRKYKLAELPEIWNILKGDMSFVGPRPDVPGYADCLTGEDRKILSLRPGLTGPATLKYRNEEELLALQPDPIAYNDNVIYPDKVRINRHYVENYSFLTDLKIIICTVFHLHMTYNGERV